MTKRIVPASSAANPQQTSSASAYKTREFILAVIQPGVEYTLADLRATMRSIGYEGPESACVTSSVERLIAAGVINTRKNPERRGRLYMLATDAEITIRRIAAGDAPKQNLPLHSSPMAWFADHCLGATA